MNVDELTDSFNRLVRLDALMKDEDWWAKFLVGHLRGTSRELAQELITAVAEAVEADEYDCEGRCTNEPRRCVAGCEALVER